MYMSLGLTEKKIQKPLSLSLIFFGQNGHISIANNKHATILIHRTKTEGDTGHLAIFTWLKGF